MKHLHSSKKAFTLIELLVVIAIIAILAAILFPVFAQAKAAAKLTASLSNVKQIAIGSVMYSSDYDDMVVFYYDRNVNYRSEDTYAGRLIPYTKNQDIFFDAMRSKPQPDVTVGTNKYYSDAVYPGSDYGWAWITNLSINSDGYATNGSGTCTAATRQQSAKSHTAIENPADRLAFAPTQYSTRNPYGWMYFSGYEAAWPTMDVYFSTYEPYNLIWDARSRYRSGKFIGSYADGHAAKFGREKFIGYFNNPANGTTEAANRTAWCTAFTNRKLDAFWGSGWAGN